MTQTTTTKRANKLTIQASETGIGWVAKFAKTHEQVAEIESASTGWQADPRLNATTNRELFRLWAMDNASKFGIAWDPTDRRTADNQFPAKYTSDALLADTIERMVRPDLDQWTAKISPELVLLSLVTDEIAPVTQSAKGAQVASKYKDGSWAWATITMTATIRHGQQEVYATMTAQLVSGQLKKPGNIGTHGYNQTGYREEVLRDLPDLAKALQEQAQQVVAQ